MYRVALLGIHHESNTFIETPTGIQDFRNSHWLTGPAIRSEYINSHHEIGGMIEVLEENNIEVIPVMFAEAVPGGMITKSAYEELVSTLMHTLEDNLPIDGCLVALHGAAVAEHIADMDGNWLSVLRSRLGPQVPVLGTLDPHANCSDKMIAATNALIAYHTNPHIDQRQTGRELARLMVRILLEKITPAQVKTDFPLAISIEQQNTGEEPCLSLYNYARELSLLPGIISISILLGFPYADVEEMGSAVIVVTDGDSRLAENIGQLIKKFVTERHQHFDGLKSGIEVIMPGLNDCAKPILLLDMGDNVGGGSPGNSSFLLDALEQNNEGPAFISLYDPEIVSGLYDDLPGSTHRVRLGDSQKESMVTLVSVSEGKFRETVPRHGGQVSFDMGRIVIVRTEAGNTVMLMSLRVPPFSLQQLLQFDIRPEDYKIIVAKGVNAPIAAYKDVCKTIIKVDTPGVTQADMKRFNYKRRRKPLFPFENIEYPTLNS